MSFQSNKPSNKWECHACTFINEDNEAEACMICETPRREKKRTNGLSKEDVFLRRDSPPKDFQESISILDFSASQNSTDREGSSLANLCHMSFAAWEDNRKGWTCKLCTFENGPRHLLCGGCGVEEGATNAVKDAASFLEDETIASNLNRSKSLRASQKHLTSTINEELKNHWEDKLKLEQAGEVNDVKRDVDSEATMRKNLSNIE